MDLVINNTGVGVKLSWLWIAAFIFAFFLMTRFLKKAAQPKKKKT